MRSCDSRCGGGEEKGGDESRNRKHRRHRSNTGNREASCQSDLKVNSKCRVMIAKQ